MIAEYKCTTRCFFNNSLHEVGVVVVADEKDMKDNPCFIRVNPPKKPAVVEKAPASGKPEKTEKVTK